MYYVNLTDILFCTNFLFAAVLLYDRFIVHKEVKELTEKLSKAIEVWSKYYE